MDLIQRQFLVSAHLLLCLLPWSSLSLAQLQSNGNEVGILGCSLEVIVDPTLYADLKENRFGSSVSRSHLDYEISSLVGRHIFFVNDIIGKYSFGRGRDAFKYRLYLKKLKILTPSSCSHKGINYCDGGNDMSSRDFLDLHSASDHDDVCLSYVFTARNFVDGSVGLAWTASTKGEVPKA
jgi:hypothetical protein